MVEAGGWVTVEEAALLAARSRQTIYNWIANGRLSTVKVGRSTLVSGRSVLEVEAQINLKIGRPRGSARPRTGSTN